MQNIFSGYNGIKLEINTESRTFFKHLEMKQCTPEQSMGQRRNLKANKKYTELNENENTPYKNM